MAGPMGITVNVTVGATDQELSERYSETETVDASGIIPAIGRLFAKTPRSLDIYTLKMERTPGNVQPPITEEAFQEALHASILSTKNLSTLRLVNCITNAGVKSLYKTIEKLHKIPSLYLEGQPISGTSFYNIGHPLLKRLSVILSNWDEVKLILDNHPYLKYLEVSFLIRPQPPERAQLVKLLEQHPAAVSIVESRQELSYVGKLEIHVPKLFIYEEEKWPDYGGKERLQNVVLLNRGSKEAPVPPWVLGSTNIKSLALLGNILPAGKEEGLDG